MIKNIKIWIGKDNPLLSYTVQRHLFTQGVRWNGLDGIDVNWGKCPNLFVGENGNLLYGNYDKKVFETLTQYTEMKLIETSNFTLEAVIIREKICIGGKEYYIDELTKALENIKPI
jgi:hypothetical protein